MINEKHINIVEPDVAQNVYRQIVSIHENSDYRNAIKDFRVEFESILMTVVEKEPDVFPSIGSVLNFIGKKYQPPKNINECIYGFKYFANKTVHEKHFEIDKNEYICNIKQLCTIIKYLSGEDVPEALSSLYSNIEYQNKVPEQQTSKFIKDSKVVVNSISELKQLSGGSAYFTIQCNEDTLGKFNINIYNCQDDTLIYIHHMLWEGATLRISNLRKSNSDEYITSVETNIVLEPDFLIDASHIAECFDRLSGKNILLYFLSKLTVSDSSHQMLKGNIVNTCLDAMLSDPDTGPEKILQQVIKEQKERNSLACISFGENKIKEIEWDIREQHIKNLLILLRECKKSKQIIEPAFFSDIYGLQGRLDVMTEDSYDVSLKNIFELKSGQSPDENGLYSNDRAQAICYALLLRSVYGNNRKGKTAILYSSSFRNPLREVTFGKKELNEIINMRNRIVFELHKLSKGNAYILKNIKIENFKGAPWFRTEKIKKFQDAYIASSALAKKYYNNLLTFVIRELQMSKIGGCLYPGSREKCFSSLWIEPIEEKKKQFNIIYGLKFISFDSADNSVEFKLEKNLNHNFRQEDWVILYAHNTQVSSPLKSKIIKGSIKKLQNNQIIFTPKNQYLNEENFNIRDADWIIEHDLYEENYWVQTRSFLGFLELPKERQDKILGIRKPDVQKTPYILNKNLDKNQNELIAKALQSKDYFLLQGPPGTGKTATMLVSLTQNIIKKTDETIAILAFTKRAVDEICEKLWENKIDYLRLGLTAKDDPALLTKKAKNKTLEEIGDIVTKTRVFVATVSSFHTRIVELKKIIMLDTLILDEATQIAEPQVVGLLAYFKKRFFMIGDHNQLPAIVIQNEYQRKINDPDLKNAGIKDLSFSLFERLYSVCKKNKWDYAYGMLETHYRMHIDIADLINNYYKGKLKPDRKTGENAKRQIAKFDIFNSSSLNPTEKLLSSSRCIFIEFDKSEKNMRSSPEAEQTALLLQQIKQTYGKNFTKKTVGVVTPWRAQIDEIRKAIQDNDILNKVTIDTVERFQGSERDIIIVSLSVNSNSFRYMQSKNIEGTVDRKLLVAISRAREQIIILGCPEILNKSSFYRALFEKIKEKSGYIKRKND